MYYFLENDFRDLCARIDELKKKIEEIGQEMGESCRQSSETYHDNFPFEEGVRQQSMLSDRLRDLLDIRNKTKVIKPNIMGNSVNIGKVVVIQDEETNEKETYKIGSYMIFNRVHGTMSYSAPLAQIILGAKAGDTRNGEIGGNKIKFKVLKVI